MKSSLLCLILLFVGCSGITVKLSGQPPVEKAIVSVPQPVREVLFFTQPGCPPCERAKSRVEEMRSQGLKVTEINVRESDLARKYQITQTPTFVVLEDGVEIERTSDIVLLVTILVKVLAWILPLFI